MKLSRKVPPSGIRVLVVDDEQLALRSVCRYLEPRGHEVVTATNLAEAMKEAKRQMIDVAVVDWHLEHETGGDVCKALSELLPPPIVIVITGEDGEDVQKRSYRAGACAHLSKPLDFEELDLLIRTFHRLRSDGSIPPPGDSPFKIGDGDQVSVNGVVFSDFSSTQVELIRLLNRHLDRIVSREAARVHVKAASEHSIRQIVYEIRQKVGKKLGKKHRKLIKSVAGGLLICSKPPAQRAPALDR